MKPYQKRVVEEKQELDKKLDALERFISSDECEMLRKEEQQQLYFQAELMGDYSSVLGERISNFK